MTPLVIGVDARELVGERTGAGRYLGELIRRWVTRPDAASRRCVLYAPEPLSMAFPEPLVTVRVLPGGRGTRWEQLTLGPAVRRDRPDVFFAPAYTAPLGLPCPFAVTIHDVSFSRRPEWFRLREGMRRRWLTRRAARRAAAVLTVSNFSAGEIRDLYDVPAERISVVLNGVTPRQVPVSVAREPLVLFVGSVFNRRRLPDLIAAFARVVGDVPQARLAIVGANRTWPRQNLQAIAASHGVAERVALLSYANEDQLALLYARASAFAFLSEYEGFGLTPLEALSAGVPAVVLDTPAAREIYGDAVHLVQPGDVEGTAATLVSLLTSPEAAARVLSRAPAVLARYSWDAAADATLAALERIAVR